MYGYTKIEKDQQRLYIQSIKKPFPRGKRILAKEEEGIAKQKKELEEIVQSWKPILNKTVKSVGELKRTISRDTEKSKETYYLLWGLGIGLVLGIIGNLMAGHYMEVLKFLIEPNIWWITNAILFSLTLVVTIVFVIWIIVKIKGIESSLGVHQKLSEEFEKFDELKEKLQNKGLIDND